MTEKSECMPNCMDCSDNNDYKYMVKDEIWLKAVPTYKHLRASRIHVYLCLTCLSTRLGRKLKINDFIPGLPINRSFFLAYEMGLLDGKE